MKKLRKGRNRWVGLFLLANITTWFYLVFDLNIDLLNLHHSDIPRSLPLGTLTLSISFIVLAMPLITPPEWYTYDRGSVRDYREEQCCLLKWTCVFLFIIQMIISTILVINSGF